MPAGDLTQGYIFVPAEKSIDQVKMNAIVGQAYINPAFISAQTESTSTTTGDYFLLLKSGGTLAKIVLDNLATSLASTTGFQSQIWSTRLRSFNSVGNPNFGVTQRNCGTVLTNPNNVFIEDRWSGTKTGTLTYTAQVINAGFAGIVLPGTNFTIAKNYLRVTLTGAQATLAAGDFLQLYTAIEGSNLLELINDVHSLSLLVRSSVSGLKFGLALQDSPPTKSLTKLCTIPTANTWTLIPLPNNPIFPSAGNFSTIYGVLGYYLEIALACGSTYTAPANDIWQNGNFFGAVGQSNFAAQVVNSTFDIAFCQHEPGAQATTLMDKPFTPNLDECQRYFTKSYPYGTKPGTASNTSGMASFVNTSPVTNWAGYLPFKKTMATIPNVTIYNWNSGAANSIRVSGADYAVSAVNDRGDSGFDNFTTTTGPAAGNWASFHYTADTAL
jgi:hypothetical protein